VKMFFIYIEAIWRESSYIEGFFVFPPLSGGDWI